MNREHEFRGFDGTKWYYGDLEYNRKYCVAKIHTYKDDGSYCRQYAVDPDTVGQFTGMRDKRGKKIYEGDIVRVCDEDDIDIGVVKYNEDFGKYVVVYSQVSGNWFDFEGTDGEFLAAFCSEVIGNVYNNPELLSTK